MTDRELMQQALDAMETVFMPHHPAVIALRDRLAQPHIKVEGPLHVVCQCDKCKTQNRWELWEAIEAKLKEKNT